MFASPRERSDHAVWSSRTRSGFVNNVFVMYHATSVDAAAAILRGGGRFRTSTHEGNMLGWGVYASHTAEKALNHARARFKTAADRFVVFRLLVYAGRVYRVKSVWDPMRKRWQRYFTAAWVKPHSHVSLSKSGLQENCIKSPNQIKIVGVCHGWDLLPQDAANLTPNVPMPPSNASYEECVNYDNHLAKRDPHVQKCLPLLLRQVGIVPFRLSFEHNGSTFFLVDSGDFEADVSLRPSLDASYFWVSSGDGCIENVKTGRFLTRYASINLLVMNRWMEKRDLRRQRAQRWKFEPSSGALINRDAGGVALRMLPRPDGGFSAGASQRDPERWGHWRGVISSFTREFSHAPK